MDRLFADPAKGLSRGAFVASAIKAGFSPTEASIHYERETAAQVHRVGRQPYHSIVAADKAWAVDLMFMDVYAGLSANRKKTGILVAIAQNSRFAWARPFRTKSPDELAPLLRELLSEQHVESITTDDGVEFKGAVRELFERSNVKHYASSRKGATSRVERFIRTLRSKISRWFAVSKSHAWVDVLQDLIESHNSTPSRVLLGHSPREVIASGELSARIRAADAARGQKAVAARAELTIGTPVRTALEHARFAKKSGKQWSDDVGVIELDRTNHLLLRVRREDGSLDRRKYAVHELQPVPGSTIDSRAIGRVTAAAIDVPATRKAKRVKQQLVRESIDEAAILTHHRGKAALPQRFR